MAENLNEMESKENIFTTKKFYNNWLQEVTVSEKELIFEMMEEYKNSHITTITAENERLREAFEWHGVKDKLPDENVTCWLYSQEYKNIFLGCRVYLNNEGFFWAKSNGVTYLEGNKIITECEIDDYDVTHWCYILELPQALTPERKEAGDE